MTVVCTYKFPDPDTDRVFLAPPQHRLPRRRYSPQRPWQPLSGDERAVLSPFVPRAAGAGRPLRDPRGRLEAISRMTAGTHLRARPPAGALWRALPPAFGGPDTAPASSAAGPPPASGSARSKPRPTPTAPAPPAVPRRLGSRSAAPAAAPLGASPASGARGARPPPRLPLGLARALRPPPAPDLSESVKNRSRPIQRRPRDRGARAMVPGPDLSRACAWLVKAAGGRPRISRCMAPP